MDYISGQLECCVYPMVGIHSTYSGFRCLGSVWLWSLQRSAMVSALLSGSSVQEESVMVKELIPIVIAAAVWGKHWTGHTVQCKCDNESVVAIVSMIFSESPGYATWAMQNPSGALGAVQSPQLDLALLETSVQHYFENGLKSICVHLRPGSCWGFTCYAGASFWQLPACLQVVVRTGNWRETT